jgi:ATP-binding cassette subfamily B protein
VALVGPTGAGKTTTVSLVERFYDIREGRILIDGYDIRDVTRQSLARQMSMVLQEPFLFSGTVNENIKYNLVETTDEEVVRAAKTVNAHGFIMRLEKGYDTYLQERGGNLSVGQRQLISFARAIVADPTILILDEATANIDSYTEMLIQRSLHTLLKGRTAIVIAHRLSTIRGADKIVVMDQGRIMETGNHQELLDKGGLYAQLYAMNFAMLEGAQATASDGEGDG